MYDVSVLDVLHGMIEQDVDVGLRSGRVVSKGKKKQGSARQGHERAKGRGKAA